MTNQRILLAGVTGTIGRAVAHDLARGGHDVTCLVRPGSQTADLPAGVTVHAGEPGTVPGLNFDAVVSCIASRSGVAEDAWAVDHRANGALLSAAKASGAGRFVLVSAICLQKPELAFQHAKLAFEGELRASGLDWTIVRPTAFFKSLSGQVARVQAGKPFLVFGDGAATACKPISDRDLAAFVGDALFDPAARNTVLPVGGPGPAITPADQALLLADLLRRPVPIRRVPPWFMDRIVGALTLAAKILPSLGAKAELARIGRYYSRESMLLLDQKTGEYDAQATPEYGADTLREHYAALISGEVAHDAGSQQVFKPAKAGTGGSSHAP
ncbi:divinylchlorophyllide 8-vinylreductase [Jannaschia faecimaris]|uniref:Divinyl chlorophyllide a 8-vinyl-reductase, chloroplastic n=1 Tax=Jannaschia faecimaris TaxID=1244108 RepID=A0A1H3JTE5_9RHOB|nr:NAD(P)H-binding protein [Jannaschia faecimaris]SDY43186.1 divinylchlorophyllide 8-vinylreductase [Jannaschia faecimaris]